MREEQRVKEREKILSRLYTVRVEPIVGLNPQNGRS